LITSPAVGDGGIAPTTVLGRIAITGLIFFGIVVVTANRATAET